MNAAGISFILLKISALCATGIKDHGREGGRLSPDLHHGSGGKDP